WKSFPAIAATSLLYFGISDLQGSHHEAQKSTTRTFPESSSDFISPPAIFVRLNLGRLPIAVGAGCLEMMMRTSNTRPATKMSSAFFMTFSLGCYCWIV